jgi:hypothetical protein
MANIYEHPDFQELEQVREDIKRQEYQLALKIMQTSLDEHADMLRMFGPDAHKFILRGLMSEMLAAQKQLSDVDMAQLVIQLEA